MTVLASLALTIAGLALVAVGGGNALIPALHDQAVSARHWLSEARFAQLVALSQAAPGPNMLLIPLIGWQAAGALGAGVALLAFVLPSTTVAILGSRWLARHAEEPTVSAFRWALGPVSGGLMLSAAWVLLQTAQRTWPYRSAVAAPGLALVAASVAILAVRFKWNPLIWLALAACCGAFV